MSNENTLNGKGIVYVLVNEAMPGYVKIGKTTNLEQRIRDLDNTSAPLPFSCFFAAEVEKMNYVERQLHNAFDDHRVRSNREFFRLSPERVVAAIMIAEHNEVTPGKDYVETLEDQRALDKARERKGNFNFRIAEIPIGATLTFTRDPDVTCVVVDNRKVNFEGETISISLAADRALRRLGFEWRGIQGPLYWEYEGETLDERRTRLEEEYKEEDETSQAAGDTFMQLEEDIQRGK